MNHLNHGPDTSEDEYFDLIVIKVDIEMAIDRSSFLKPHHYHLPLRTYVDESIQLPFVILKICIFLIVEEGECWSIRYIIDPVADQNGSLIQEENARPMPCS